MHAMKKFEGFEKVIAGLAARDFKKIRRCSQSKNFGYLKKMQAGFGGFEHESLKILHYEL